MSRAAVVVLLLAAVAPAAEPADKARELAGTAEFLRGVPKSFARVQAVDPARRTVTLLAEGDKQAKTWPLTPEGEVRIDGWWGRLDQLRRDDRVWVWFKVSREKKPVAIFLLADEVSEQDLHGTGMTLVRRDGASLIVKPVKGDERTLDAGKAEVLVKGSAGKIDALKDGERFFVQTAGGQARLVMDTASFEARRALQRKALAERWGKEGLPGTVTVLHLSGEMDYLLDHEAMRWGRSLREGDEVQLAVTPPIKGVVKGVKPWRERTLLRLVVRGLDQADLSVGQRVDLRMKAPADSILESTLPPDIDRPRTEDERIEWFMSSIYCTCKVGGDGCTGHYYTLASCNPNACGMPARMRRTLQGLIDKGKNDREIFDTLLKDHGPDLIRPHLLP